MPAFLSWYVAITLLGWLVFPLTYRLFPALADRGYSLARAAALLLWGYAFWLLASLGVAQNDLGGLMLALAILVGLSAWALWKRDADGHSPISNPRSSIIDWLKANLRLVLTVESLFLVAFAFLATVRAANPEIVGTEKPMDLAFINAILRSPTFPPNDPWLSGYAISYYYFGHIMTAMLAKLTAVPGSVAFNLMIALVFALSAVGAYGILYNLLSECARRESGIGNRESSFGLPLLAPLFLLLVSNLEGFLEMLHRRGLFWPPDSQPAARNFWTWLDIKDLNVPPAQPLGWIPERYWWWWRASRVVQDYDLAGNWREVIDEFPFFSYLLADLHPHVLAMPFGLLAVAVALNLFLGGWRGETNLLGLRLSISRAGFLFSALTVGGLAFLNTWDILVAFALVVAAYLLVRVRQDGWRWERLADLLEFGLPLGILALLLYLPFYLGFSSQAGGILPNLVSPTRGAHLWVMFGSLLLPIFAYLLYLWRKEKAPADWARGLGFAFLALLLLWSLSWLLGLGIGRAMPEFAAQFLQSQGSAELRTFFVDASLRRLSYLGGTLTLFALLALAFSLLIAALRQKPDPQRPVPDPRLPSSFILHPSAFVLLLILLGSLLVLAPEFLYLRDQFGARMNTIFKFYYQAWLLWSLAAAFGAAVLLQRIKACGGFFLHLGLALFLAVTLTYPVLGLFSKTNNFNPPSGWMLDGAAHIGRENPDEAAAIRWLQSAPFGVVAEAVGGSYTGYARFATHTGLPTVLGWPGHESQWRGGYEPQGARAQDIETLYTTPDWNVAEAIMTQYDIRYVVVGSLERTTYRVNEGKFQRLLRPTFRQGSVVIYEAP